MPSSFAKAVALLFGAVLSLAPIQAIAFTASEIVAAPGDKDFGAHVLVTDPNLDMSSIRQVGAFGNWLSWQSLGAKGYVRAVLRSPGSNQFDYFVSGGLDKSVYHRKGNSRGYIFDGLGLPGFKDLSVARIPGGGFEIFAIGADNQVWHRWQDQPDAAWSDWESLGGWGSRVAAVTIPNGGLEVYVRQRCLAQMARPRFWQLERLGKPRRRSTRYCGHAYPRTDGRPRGLRYRHRQCGLAQMAGQVLWRLE
jgi:hypothetical protein